MKATLFFTGIFSIAALLLSALALYGTHDHAGFLENRASLVIRKIGHTLLLHAGDSSSRILPVKRMNESTFQLEFQSSFSFMPDTLVTIVQANLADSNLALDYMVNVFECSSQEVVYGFAVGPGQADIVPCLGRMQPEGCYTIQITFADIEGSNQSARQYFLFTLALASLAAFAFVGRAWVKQPISSLSAKDPRVVSIGSYAFYQEQGLLKNKAETIPLSGKEIKLLNIFATHQNQLIERDRLLKEVWEDEGVFTGRSLDVFISKLRKKLQHDTSVRLTNMHGKGYTLEVDA